MLEEKEYAQGAAFFRYVISSVQGGESKALTAPFPGVDSPTKTYFWVISGASDSPVVKGSLKR